MLVHQATLLFFAPGLTLHRVLRGFIAVYDPRLSLLRPECASRESESERQAILLHVHSARSFRSAGYIAR